jgi:hypothetical protein
MALRDQLLGAWQLETFEQAIEDGPTSYPLGEDATGFIIYTPQGFMSAQLMRSGREPYDTNDPYGGTEEQRAAAAHGYLSYGGRFTIDPEEKFVEHHLIVSLCPNWIGSTQRRYCQIDGDTLTLSAGPRLAQGVLATPRIVWTRAA